MSSSVTYREVKAVRQVETHRGADTRSTVSYLSLRLTQNPKLKIKRHSVFIEGGYEFWSLGDERDADMKRPVCNKRSVFNIYC